MPNREWVIYINEPTSGDIECPMGWYAKLDQPDVDTPHVLIETSREPSDVVQVFKLNEEKFHAEIDLLESMREQRDSQAIHYTIPVHYLRETKKKRKGIASFFSSLCHA